MKKIQFDFGRKYSSMPTLRTLMSLMYEQRVNTSGHVKDSTNIDFLKPDFKEQVLKRLKN